MITDKVYKNIAFYTSNARSIEDKIRFIDELVRLLEIRVKEIEKSGLGLFLVIKGERLDDE